MKTLAKAVAIASLATAGVMTSTAANAEVSFNASLVSNFVFRGFTYTDEGAAIQGGVDYAHDSGAYVGAWASNLDYGTETDTEYDIYVGYWMEAGDFEIDLGYTTYNYVEFDEDNTAEVYANITRGAVTASVYQDVELYETTYMALAYSAELPAELALDVAVGYTLDENDTYGDDYMDLSASISKSFEIVDVALTLTNEDLTDETYAFVSVSKEF